MDNAEFPDKFVKEEYRLQFAGPVGYNVDCIVEFNIVIGRVLLFAFFTFI